MPSTRINKLVILKYHKNHNMHGQKKNTFAKWAFPEKRLFKNIRFYLQQTKIHV